MLPKKLERLFILFLLPLLAGLAFGLIRLLLFTCKIHVIGLAHYLQTVQNKHPCLLVLWHNRVALTPYFASRYTRTLSYTPLISNSRDGNLIATALKKCKNISPIRVAPCTRAQAAHALLQALKEQKIPVITPDGPNGPRYEAKRGALFLAKQSHAQLIPFSWAASRYWELATWDGLRIPKPFSKIVFCFGKALPAQKEPAFLSEALEACHQEAVANLR